MLINENRLKLSSPESRQFLMEQCERSSGPAARRRPTRAAWPS
jgi:hypothetical protein